MFDFRNNLGTFARQNKHTATPRGENKRQTLMTINQSELLRKLRNSNQLKSREIDTFSFIFWVDIGIAIKTFNLDTSRE